MHAHMTFFSSRTKERKYDPLLIHMLIGERSFEICENFQSKYILKRNFWPKLLTPSLNPLFEYWINVMIYINVAVVPR